VGQTQKSGDAISTSALPPTADIPDSGCEVRKDANNGSDAGSFDNFVGTRRDHERHLLEGCGIMTPAIATLGREAVQCLIQTIATF
jgi:hypothetical protein